MEGSIVHLPDIIRLKKKYKVLAPHHCICVFYMYSWFDFLENRMLEKATHFIRSFVVGCALIFITFHKH